MTLPEKTLVVGCPSSVVRGTHSGHRATDWHCFLRNRTAQVWTANAADSGQRRTHTFPVFGKGQNGNTAEQGESSCSFPQTARLERVTARRGEKRGPASGISAPSRKPHRSGISLWYKRGRERTGHRW